MIPSAAFHPSHHVTWWSGGGRLRLPSTLPTSLDRVGGVRWLDDEVGGYRLATELAAVPATPHAMRERVVGAAKWKSLSAQSSRISADKQLELRRKRSSYGLSELNKLPFKYDIIVELFLLILKIHSFLLGIDQDNLL